MHPRQRDWIEGGAGSRKRAGRPGSRCRAYAGWRRLAGGGARAGSPAVLADAADALGRPGGAVGRAAAI